MDPNAALKSARECLITACTTDDDEIKEEALTNMMGAFDALDGWLSHGGFLPADWITRPQEARQR